MKILIAIPSPREIPEVKQALDEIKYCDKLWIKNYKEYEACKIARTYLLEHDEYSYLVIAPDDMVVNKTSFDRLVQDLIKRPTISVLCGYSNRDLSNQYKHESTTSIDYLPSWDRVGREYKCQSMEYFEQIGLSDNPVIQVKYAGFPCMVIRRDVVGLTTLGNDYPDNEEMGCCSDVVFCNECNRLGIPIFCDTRCRFLHLKESDQVSGRVWHKVRNISETLRRFYIEPATEVL
jgi:hypothetical protein